MLHACSSVSVVRFLSRMFAALSILKHFVMFLHHCYSLHRVEGSSINTGKSITHHNGGLALGGKAKVLLQDGNLGDLSGTSNRTGHVYQLRTLNGRTTVSGMSYT